jgi:hypothetical protein
MVQNERMPLMARMAGEIVQHGLNARRIEYSIIPSKKIDPKDLDSLKSSRYSVEYGQRSEMLDVEELTVLAMLIAQQKMIFESGAVRPGPDGKINMTVKVNSAPDDQTILAMASKTVFSPARLVN